MTSGAASLSRCSLTFIGTATMLLRFGPLTVLTDPNFLHRGQRAYLGYGLVAKRLTQPALSVGEVPPLDAIVLSHMHGDHWDREAKRGLARDVPVLTTPKAARALVRQGFAAAHPLATWQDTTLHREGHALRVTALPGRHAPGLARRLLPPVMGSMLDYTAPDGRGLRLYISGDTLLIDELRAVPQRFPDIDVAALHLGGTRIPAGALLTGRVGGRFGLASRFDGRLGGLLVTMDARQGADLLELIHPRSAVPIHYDDYGVFTSPLAAFQAETQRRGIGHLVRIVHPGETADL